MKFIIICTILFTGTFCFGQTIQKIKNDKKLIYYYVGEGCPSCNDKHPESKYGFIIECVGCLGESEKNKNNNKKTTEILDKKYGKGWTEKYLKNYCEE